MSHTIIFLTSMRTHPPVAYSPPQQTNCLSVPLFRLDIMAARAFSFSAVGTQSLELFPHPYTTISVSQNL